MAKRKIDKVEELEPPVDDADESGSTWQRAPLWLRAFSTVFILGVVLVASFEIAYAGKVFPGVQENGVDVGGLSQTDALSRLSERVTQFSGSVVTISNGDTNLRIPVADLSATYDSKAAAASAYNYGRQGGLTSEIAQQYQALVGHVSSFSNFAFDDSRLLPYILQFDQDLVSPVADASLSFDSGRPQVTPAQPGERLDLGRLTQQVSDRLSQTSSDAVQAPVYQLQPVLSTAALTDVIGQLGAYVAGPITLSYSGTESTVIDQPTIISWIQVGSQSPKEFTNTLNLADLYSPPSLANITLNKASIQSYVASLAGNIDQTAQNAGLAMQNGSLSVVQPSRTGIKLDQARTADDIVASLSKSSSDRAITLKLDTTQADVNENNLRSKFRKVKRISPAPQVRVSSTLRPAQLNSMECFLSQAKPSHSASC